MQHRFESLIDMTLTRRELTRLACGAAIAPALLNSQTHPRIALQLYSIRDVLKADLPGTLASVRKMGFEAVEWFGWGGYFGLSGKELRKLLDDNGLRTSSDHIHAGSLQGERFERSVEFYQTLGANLVTLSELLGNRAARGTPQFWENGARLLNELAAKLEPFGIRIGLHNHRVEFVRLPDGRVPWELVFDNAGKNVAQQLDLGSCLSAGVDPAVYLKRYAGRTRSLHMKDWAPDNPDVLLGQGAVKWPEVIALSESAGGVEWYIVEQERHPYPPMESVAKSLHNLKEILAQRAS